METREFAENEGLYEPTAEQAERAAKLSRFNRLYIYAPIGFFGAIALVLVVTLLIVAVNPPSEEALIFISGLADVAMVLAMLPALIFGAFLLVMTGYVYVQARRSGTAPIRQTQRLLWRMDNVIGRLRVRTALVADAVAQPFLWLNGVITYVKVLVMQIVGIVKRS